MSREYQAYLIRFERSSAQANWHVHVENAQSGETLHFATEWELLRFLMQALSLSLDSPPAKSEADTEGAATAPARIHLVKKSGQT